MTIKKLPMAVAMIVSLFMAVNLFAGNVAEASSEFGSVNEASAVLGADCGLVGADSTSSVVADVAEVVASDVADSLPQPQRKNPSDYRFELRAGYSQLPFMQTLLVVFSSWPSSGEELGMARLTGTFALEFDWNILKWLSVGVAADVSNFSQRVYVEDTREEVGKYVATFVTVMPDVRFSWLNKGIVRLYLELSFGAGMIMYNDTTESTVSYSFYPAFQVTPLGVSLGRKVYGFLECGAGTEYLGAMAGVGVRF